MDYQTAVNLPPAEKVAAGAQLLDEKHPGWYEKIDLKTLDINDGCRCICGQLGKLEKQMWEEYSSALMRNARRPRSSTRSHWLDVYTDDEWSVFVHAHGFAAESGVTDEWKRAIQARRDADALQVREEAACAEKHPVMV